MRMLVITIVAVLLAAPAFAENERGYILGAGGFSVSPDTTSGDVLGEAGVKVAPRLRLFGDLGQFHNLQPSEIQPLVDNTTATLAGGAGLNVIGTARVPAWYSLGGLRFDVPAKSRFSPYVLGGLGFARLTPRARFTYSSGTLPDSTPSAGDDVTTQLISSAEFTQPPASSAFMFSTGAGMEVPMMPHWAADIGYRFSRIQADTPVNSEAVTFGLGYRF